MANKHRGEAKIKLGSKTYVMRPTFENLCDIEDRLGAGILEIAQRGINLKLGIRDMAVIVHASIADDPPTLDEVGEALVAAGMADAAEPVSRFLEQALGGGVEAKNADAAKG